jgi:hypothetical protein
MGLELEMFSLKALLLGCLHYLHVCYFFDPLLPQGMDIETLRRTSATVCLLWMSVGYSLKRLHTPSHCIRPSISLHAVHMLCWHLGQRYPSLLKCRSHLALFMRTQLSISWMRSNFVST